MKTTVITSVNQMLQSKHLKTKIQVANLKTALGYQFIYAQLSISHSLG